MPRTINAMQTRLPITRRVITRAGVRAEIAEFENRYPGLAADNVGTYFNGDDGVIPTDKLTDALRAGQLYDMARASAVGSGSELAVLPSAHPDR